MQLSSAQRRRGLLVLLIDNFLMFGGFFMLVPLISVHYVENLGFAAAAIGVVLAARQLTQQGLTLIGGALADRWGAKSLICWGLAIRIFGFLGLAWATSFGALLAMCVLAALGGALFEAPKNAAVAALAEPQQRTRFFGLNGVAGGLGMTIGPLVGSLLLRLDFGWVCLVSAACFAVAAVVSLIGLPRIEAASTPQSLGGGIARAARNRPFVAFTVLLAGFWFMWVQLSISLTLMSQRWGAPELISPWGPLSVNGVAWIYGINAGMTVLLQYPLLRLAERWLRPLPIVIVGTGCAALGLSLVATARSLPMLLGCVAIFSLGVMLVMPTQQTVTAQFAEPQLMGAYFGVAALALAFGGASGNYLGGWLYDAAQRWHLPALPWLVFGAVGCTVAVGLALLDRYQRRASPGAVAWQPSRTS